MEWNEKLQLIIDYVENHLQRDEEPIDIQEIVKLQSVLILSFKKCFHI